MNRKRSTVAALAAIIAGGLVFAGCGREPSIAGKSAAAFSEAQEKGEAFGGEGHAHGGMAHPQQAPEAAGGETAGHAAMEHGGHAAMEHAQRPAAPGGHGGHAAMQPDSGPHAGHGPTTSEAPPAAMPPAGHAGHMPAAPPVPAHASPGQPAATLRPDAADAPAATSVIDAQRAAALASEMAGGGHGGHGAGTYRQLDAGRAPTAQPESQEHEEHDHKPPAERRQA